MFEPLQTSAVRRITVELGAAGDCVGAAGGDRRRQRLAAVALSAANRAAGGARHRHSGEASYFLSPSLKAYFRTIGLYPLTVLHVWRIPAALVFFWYGAHGALPPVFWILAGSGDFLSGVLALPLLRGPANRSTYLSKHLFGFADFVVAVGTGLTLTLLHDPRMAPIRDLPLALIPLFGVGISGASHIIAFHLLWTERRIASASGLVTA